MNSSNSIYTRNHENNVPYRLSPIGFVVTYAFGHMVYGNSMFLRKSLPLESFLKVINKVV